MSLTKLEKISYVGGPWFFGVTLIICGIIVTNINPASFQGVLLICSGLLCMSIYCVCALLAKIISSK